MDNTTTRNIGNFSMKLNTTGVGEDQRGFPLVNIVFSSVILLAMLCCWVLNVVVVKAVSEIGESKMSVKFLLLNAIFGDVLLSISLGVREMFLIARIDSEQEAISVLMLCVNMIFEMYNYFATFYQIFSSMVLALDRLYSIVYPLRYHTMRYSLRQKVVIILVLFLFAMGLSLPVALLKIKPDESPLMICLGAADRGPYSEDILPYAIISSVCLTMFFYCALFAMITYYRLRKETSLGKGPGYVASRKRQMSLALTFFFIHITYVLLYIPGALYYSSVGYNLPISEYHHKILAKVVILLYLSNTIFDPIIYMLRINSIRVYVNSMICKARLNVNTNNTQKISRTEQGSVFSLSNMTTIPETTSG